MEKRFSPKQHLHAYSRVLLNAFLSPALIFFIVVGNLFLLLCLFAFYYFEFGINPVVTNFFDVIWWGFSTVTTVGYGDIIPMTWQGRVAAIFLMVLGVSFYIAFTSIWVTTFMNASTKIFEQELLAEDLLSKEELIERRLAEVEKSLKRIESLISNK